jgi:serine protease inhibitor
VSWILKMKTYTDDRTEAYISQAIQQTILKMNEEGARAKSAFAGYMPLGTRIPKEKPDMIIDAPFLVWFMRPLLNKPLFVGYIATEDWKNPGSIY